MGASQVSREIMASTFLEHKTPVEFLIIQEQLGEFQMFTKKKKKSNYGSGRKSFKKIFQWLRNSHRPHTLLGLSVIKARNELILQIFGGVP